MHAALGQLHGQVADHIVATIPIICTNVGTAIPVTNLIIDPPTASPAAFDAQFDQSSDVYPLNGLAPGDSAQIDVSYTRDRHLQRHGDALHQEQRGHPA